MKRAGQHGFSLVPALFLLIVLAGLGVIAVRLSAVQQQTVVLAMQSARAYAAARTGIEWSAYQALAGAGCANATISLTEGGLAGFNVDTSCSETIHSEGPDVVRIFALKSFAWSGSYGTPDYVSRQILSTVTDAI